MLMKGHILAALREEFHLWEELLGGLSEEQITATDLPSNWSVKDVVAHLRAWQQRSVARVEAALDGRDPVYPGWPADLDPEDEGQTEPVNAWIYESYCELPWSQVYQDWREGFQRFLQASERVAERDLLDGNRYPWLNGSPLALVLLGSYDHHQEHLEMLQERGGYLSG